MPTGPYRTLLACGAYKDGISETTLTLGGLEPGHAYLVQIWVADLRPGTGLGRWWTPDDFEDHIPYKTGTAPLKLGGFATGCFVASGTTHAVKMNFGTKNGQFNALQVRDLGADATVWGAARSSSTEAP